MVDLSGDNEPRERLGTRVKVQIIVREAVCFLDSAGSQIAEKSQIYFSRRA